VRVKQVHALFFCFLVASPLLWARIQETVASEKDASKVNHLSLDGKWKLFYFPQGKYQISHPDQLKPQGLTSIEALVPGEVALDLSREGELPGDLFFADNITKLSPYELYEWWYQREFQTPKGIAGRRLELRFHGVDCLATYWLNGRELGTSANALVEQHFDVTGKLNASGPNTLTIRLKSPIVEAAGKQYDPAYTVADPIRQAGSWIRRPAETYSYDISPRVVSAGLWGSVELIVHSQHEITDMYFTTYSLTAPCPTLSLLRTLHGSDAASATPLEGSGPLWRVHLYHCPQSGVHCGTVRDRSPESDVVVAQGLR